MQESNLLGLDVGERRVGVAIAHTVARLPRPMTTLERGPNFWDDLKKLVAEQSVSVIVVGIPRSLRGTETTQTTATQAFIADLQKHTDLPIEVIDEAVTSKQAVAELQARGKRYSKGDIDALAATYILQDYLDGYKLEGKAL